MRPAPPKDSDEVVPNLSVPLPVLVRPVTPAPAVVVRVPLKLAVTARLGILMVRPVAPRVTGPASVTPAPPSWPAKMKLPLTVTGL